MNRKTLAIAAIAVAGALTAGLAQARDRNDVQWSVTIGNPAPVWVQPAPVYGAPLVVRSYGGHPDRRYDQHQRQSRWDRDGDGVPNRYDRVDNRRWDRDGDGIPNRYDRVYNPRWDRDGDGVPNRYDRHDDTRHGRGR